MLTILIADDHALFRAGMRHVLVELDDKVDVIEAANYEQATDIALQNPDIDLVLLDLSMPGKDGFSVLECFSRNLPALPVVIISASTLKRDIQRALDLGALGFISKESTSSVMLNALKLIMAGGIYVPESLIREQQHNQGNLTQSPGPNLTPRQLDVLSYMVEGYSNKEIGRALNLTEATVKMHVSAILKAMQVKNRTKAIRAVAELGLQLPGLRA